MRSPTDASWTDYDPENPPWHTYDMTSLNGQDLWFIGTGGQDGNEAVAWRSTDGGKTWPQQPFRVYTGGTIDAYYFIGNLNGKIYLQAHPDEKNSEVFDGTTLSWTTGPNLFPTGSSTGFRPVDFDGQMVYYDKEASINDGVSGVDVFDGTDKAQSLTSNTFPISIFNVDGNYLYAATPAGIIYRTTDLKSWELLGGGGLDNGETAESIAVLNNDVYIGTTDSNIYCLGCTLP